MLSAKISSLCSLQSLHRKLTRYAKVELLYSINALKGTRLELRLCLFQDYPFHCHWYEKQIKIQSLGKRNIRPIRVIQKLISVLHSFIFRFWGLHFYDNGSADRAALAAFGNRNGRSCLERGSLQEMNRKISRWLAAQPAPILGSETG